MSEREPVEFTNFHAAVWLVLMAVWILSSLGLNAWLDHLRADEPQYKSVLVCTQVSETVQECEKQLRPVDQ